MPYLKHCVVCGKQFVARNGIQLCCSAECSVERSKALQRKYDKERYEAKQKVERDETPKPKEYKVVEKPKQTDPILRRLSKGLPPHEECHQCVYWKSITGSNDVLLDVNKMCYFAQNNPYCRKRSADRKRCLSFLQKGEKNNDDTKHWESPYDA